MAGRIAVSLGGNSAVIKLHDAQDRVQLVEHTANLNVAERLQDWAGHWHARDLWVQRSVSYGLSRIVTSDELVTRQEQRSSGFYQEWLPHLDIYHMIGAVFPTESGAIGVLGIHRPADAESFAAQDRRKVALLLPHLERAMRIGQSLSQASFARDTALRCLDALDTGVIVAEASGRIRHMNAAAEAILAAGDGLRVAGEKLCARPPGEHSRLRAAIAANAGFGMIYGFDPPTALRIERDGRTPLTLSASPLRPRQTAWQEPLALLLLRDPEYPPYRIDALQEIFGFTRREAIVAAALARGRTLEEIAGDMTIGIGTVRSHLKQILHKSGANRQAAAVALIARSVATMPLN